MTPEYVAEMIGLQYSPVGPHGRTYRQATTPAELTMLARLDVDITAMLGELRATCRYDTLIAETVDGAAPVTEMGRAEAEFFGRG